MVVFVAAVAGFLAGRLCWVLLRPLFRAPALTRPNYRGCSVATAAGLVLPVALLVVEAGRVLARAAGEHRTSGLTVDRVLVLVAVLGFALLGLVDDLAGAGEARGFRGHVSQLRRGRLTSGGLKLIGGGALALVVVAPAEPRVSFGRLVADAALVALAANLANLLDRRPGRTIKSGLAAFVVLAVATAAPRALASVATIVGASFALLVDDLHERLMIGDTGANALGAAVGLGVVVACAPRTRTVVLVVVLALNLLSELVSFTRLVEAVPPLRWLDGMGQRASD